MIPMRGSDEERLDALFQAYAAACPTPEPSANFMPNLWAKIEARQSFTFSFGRMANGFVTAAAALTLALGIYMAVPHNTSAPETYLEALADAHPLDTPDLVSPASLDLPDSGR